MFPPANAHFYVTIINFIIRLVTLASVVPNYNINLRTK